MLYKMIYFSSHKFAFSNLRFSPFYEHFRQLREKHAFKLKIKYIMLISLLRRIWWCTFIWLFLKKNHSTCLFKIFFSLLTLSTAFLQKASGPGKNIIIHSMLNLSIHLVNQICEHWKKYSASSSCRYSVTNFRACQLSFQSLSAFCLFRLSVALPFRMV